MRSGGGKAKGSEFERRVCKLLSLWVSDGKHEDCFWRSAMSGGRSTVGLKAGKHLSRQAGDITATAPEGAVFTERFYVECKHVKSLDLESFIFKGKGALAGFHTIAQREARAHKRKWLIIAQQNRLPAIVLAPHNSFPRSVDHNPIMERRLDYEIWYLSRLLKQPYVVLT